MKKVVPDEFDQGYVLLSPATDPAEPGHEAFSQRAHQICAIVGQLYRNGDLPQLELVPAQAAATALARIQNKRLREQFFPDDIFTGPGWDILVKLTLAKIRGSKIAYFDRFEAEGVSSESACRSVEQLVKRGLITRRFGLEDHRRCFLEIEDTVFSNVIAFALVVIHPILKG